MATFYIRNVSRQPGYQVTADNWNELNGDLNELNRRLVFQIPAESFKPRSGGVIIEPDGDREDYRATYPDGETSIATYRLIVPLDYNAAAPSPLELHANWYAAATGNVRWAAVLELVQRGESVDAPRVSAAILMTATIGTADDAVVTPLMIPAATISALPADAVAKPIGPGDTLRIRLERRGADAADTLPDNAYLLHVLGRFQTSAASQIP